MSKSDAEIAREIMYDEVKEGSTPKPLKEIKVQSTRTSVIVESGGVKHQVPSSLAFNQLAREHGKTKDDLRQARIDIKKLTETIKKMNSALLLVEQELTNKADRYDND